MKRHQKGFSLYNLIIGALALVAVGIFVFAIQMSDLTRDADIVNTEEYQAALEERIRPFGQVYLPGEEHGAPEPVIEEAAPVEPVATSLTGPQVYNEACIVCHGAGIGGAPTLADPASWGPRIAQGTATLYDHAINGYAGQAGYMPPKGARLDLSDDEVNAAVDYMLGELQN